MSVNNVSSFWGKDYAAELKEKWESKIQESKEKLANSGVTVPIGQSGKNNKDMKGLVVEHQAKDSSNTPINRELSTSEVREKAVEDAKQAYLKFGTVEGKEVESEKEAEKMAKNYVKDKRYEEDSNSTQVFMDKQAYKAAEKARKEQRSKLIEQYRNEGLSRKEAKQKADAQLPENEYVRGRKTREYVESHKDLFYDEKGNFSSDKFKQTALNFANTHTEQGEAENHYLSLKERREVAEQENVKASVIKNIAKKSNLGYERDNTNLYRGLYVAGVTGVGAGIGAALGASGILASNVIAKAASSSSSSSDSSATVNGGSAGSSTATDSSNADANANAIAKGKYGLTNAKQGAGVGALTGLGLGLATMDYIKDRGNKEAKIYTPGEAKKPEPSPQPEKPPVDNQVPPDVQPVVPPVIEDCPEERWESEYCDYKVQKGDYWAGVIQGKMTYNNGKKPDGKILKALIHAEKLKHGVTNFSLNTMPHVGQNMRLYTDFSDLLENEEYMKKYPELKYLKDLEIEIDCDGKVVTKSSGKPKHKFIRWTGSPVETNRYKQDCHDNVPVRIN